MTKCPNYVRNITVVNHSFDVWAYEFAIYYGISFLNFPWRAVFLWYYFFSNIVHTTLCGIDTVKFVLNASLRFVYSVWSNRNVLKIYCIWHNVFGILGPQCPPLCTCLALQLIWSECHWWDVLCRRNARLAYQIMILIPLITIIRRCLYFSIWISFEVIYFYFFFTWYNVL